MKETNQGSFEKVLSIIGTCVKDFRDITDSINNLSGTRDKRKKVDADIAVNASKAETDARKEGNRHDEEMARIEIEYKKISEAKENGELRWSMIHDINQMFIEDYKKIIAMDIDEYKSPEIQQTVMDLRKTLNELSKELIRAK